ncbi:hypothetical protein HKBW3S42_00214 [Candidatus Hakubella thermalkaliphila]|uniref:Uncharacterized protein n=1 Tax=Candidatus Hakubella thermalkaliphila TaxID=2754717 RepID=A0A6V8PI43_9ACTN|nr:hypothetical protein HKBW3S42_00214 [Candidatus Hakubella thermalkaliphila]
MKIKAILFNFAPITKNTIEYGVKPLRRFKTRFSCFFSSFYSSKEGFKGLIQPPQGLLERTIVAKGKLVILFPQFWKQSCGLISIANAFTSLLVKLFSLSKSLIVKISVSLKLKGKGASLFFT